MVLSRVKRYISFLSFFACTCLFSQSAFKPSDVAGLRLWLAADSGIVLNGSQVSQWNDISGNGNDASQSVVSSQPFFIDSVSLINNSPVIRFNGNGEYLTFPEIKDIRTVFWVIKEDSDATNYYRALLGHFVKYDFHRGDNQEFWRAASASANVKNGITRLGPVVINGVVDKLPQKFSLISVITTGNVSASNFSWDQNYSTRFWDGDLAELIIYNQPLIDADRLHVEQYLRDKYAPAVNLGSNITMNSLCDTMLNAGVRFAKYKWNGSNADTNRTFDAIKAGKYWVDVTDIFGFTSSDTVVVTYPLNEIAKNNLICYGDTLVWKTGLNPNNYTFLWSNNATTASIKITQTGSYYVVATEISTGCSMRSDTSSVIVDTFSLGVSLGADKNVCSGEKLSLISGASQAVNYLWSTGATTSSIIITASGVYSLTVQNNKSCIAKDTMVVTIKGIAPIPNFSSTTSCFGDASLFTDLSTVPTPDSIASWNWNFGDAASSSVQHPSHTYTAAGTYTASLVVVSDSGCMAALQKAVIVNPKPNANFSFSSFVCSGTSMQFSDLSSVASPSTIISWSWNFGDITSMNNTANVKNPAHVYKVAGTYTVQLIVTSSLGCKDTVLLPVAVMQSPVAVFTATSVCKGNNTVFSDNSTGGIISWSWNFGDASSNSSLKNPTHKYFSAGTYSATLSVVASNGCVNKDTNIVSVYFLPNAGFKADTICVNSTLQFTDTSSVTGSTINLWNWQFGSSGSSSLQHPAFTYTATGINSVTLSVTSAQSCSASVTHSVTVLPLPNAAFSFSPPNGGAPPLNVSFNSSLSSGSTNYQWNFGDGSQSFFNNPSHVYKDTGLYAIVLIAKSNYGCSDTAAGSIYVAYPFLDVAATALSALPQTNTLPVSIVLYNDGTLNVSSLELSAYLDNGTPVHEFWTGLLKPHSLLNYKFNSSFEIQNNLHSMVCVEVKLVNGIADNDLTNNKSCAAITNEFTLLDPFPNPASDDIYILFVSPDASNIKAEIIDVRGREVAIIYDGNASKGLNQLTYNTLKLDKGYYALRLSHKGKSTVKIFVKK